MMEQALLDGWVWSGPLIALGLYGKTDGLGARFGMRHWLRLKLGLVLCAPVLAMAAEQMILTMDPSTLPLMTWLFILMFSNGGWLVSELDKLAEIIVSDGISKLEHVRNLLKFTQGWIASNMAGIGVYFIAKSSPAWINMEAPSEMIVLLAVCAGGYSGVRFWDWAKARFFK